MKSRTLNIRKIMSHPDFMRILILRTFGNFLVLSSLFMIGKTFYQPVTEEARFFIDKLRGTEYVVATEFDRDFGSSEPKGGLSGLKRNVEVLVPKDPEFGIVIPKIAANASIIENVDAADQKKYLEALQQGVAHAEGTAYPGEGGHVYLFAHSTDYFWNVGTYNAVFYLLSKLENDDEVDLFYKGKRNVYKVVDKKIVNPDQVQYLLRKTPEEFVTLQTCWPPGTTLKRLLVFAKKVGE